MELALGILLGALITLALCAGSSRTSPARGVPEAEREPEAEVLRAQISPHFAYNALTAVAGHIHARPDEARELLSDFAELTRHLFRPDAPSHVTLARELDHVERYLRLERARFGARLTVEVDVASELLDTAVPVLSLQPLVENAVRHGMRAGGGRVEVAATRVRGGVRLAVRDDGPGMSSERAQAALAGACDGIGLWNVHRRLLASHGAGLEIRSAPGEGTTVAMTVPQRLPEVVAA